MTFEECLLETAKAPELYEQFCRLKGYKPPKSPIEAMIDQATNREKEILKEYAAFVFEHIYLPVFVWPSMESAHDI